MDKDIEKKPVHVMDVSIPEKPEPIHIPQLPSAAWEHTAADCLGP